MMNSPGQFEFASDYPPQGSQAQGGNWQRRFNVLLTQDRPRVTETWHWTCQLPRLLQPQGVVAYVVSSGAEAIQLAGQTPIHAAVIDLATPRDAATDQPSASLGADAALPGGVWLLELLNRLQHRPPVIVLRGPAHSRRHAERLLLDFLRLGAFSVLDKPVGVEQILSVFQKLLERKYGGYWPS
ncbi:MAG: response regulator transcription factor [Phycisphaeraceae bacterium]|nr:response regulator transcription factor [Phycisphaeraceae bacterium]